MTKDEMKLFEKIIRAKVALEYKVEHSDNCMSNDLTGYSAPCNCGALSRAKDSAIARAKLILDGE